MTPAAQSRITRPRSDASARVAAIDWTQATNDLDAQGCAVLKGLLTPEECRALAALYPEDEIFRSRVVMGRHGFGRGEYKYFAYPLPQPIAELRPRALCAPPANRQPLERGDGDRYPLSRRARGVPGPVPQRRPDFGRRRCCCNMAKAITTACTRTSTANTSFRCRSRSCCRNRLAISKAASSC